MTDPWNIGRFIFECESKNLETACEAVRYLMENAHLQKIAATYGDSDAQVSYHVKRGKDSITVKQNHTP